MNISKGAFNNYVDKMGGGQKMPIFFTPRVKNHPRRGGGGQKWQNCVNVVLEWPLLSYISLQIQTRQIEKYSNQQVW